MRGCFNDALPDGGVIPVLASAWAAKDWLQAGGGPGAMLQLSAEACGDLAGAGGWSVFGLREGVRCYVGFDLVAAMSGGASAAATCAGGGSSCLGTPEAQCGGDDFLHVYELPGEAQCAGVLALPAGGGGALASCSLRQQAVCTACAACTACHSHPYQEVYAPWLTVAPPNVRVRVMACDTATSVLSLCQVPSTSRLMTRGATPPPALKVRCKPACLSSRLQAIYIYRLRPDWLHLCTCL